MAENNRTNRAQSLGAEEKIKSKARKEKIKRTEKWEENPIKNYFVRLFGKVNFKNEAQFLYFGKWLVFLVLLTVEVLMLLEILEVFKEK